MFRSDDGGATFAPRNDGVNSADEGFCVHSLAHDPAQPDAIIRRDHRGMYRSDDAGDSWRVIENGLPVAELADGHRCCFGFACQLDPGSGSLFTVPLESDGFRYPKDAELAVYRSRNGEMDGVELTQEVNAKYLAAAALAEAIAQDLESQAGNSLSLIHI